MTLGSELIVILALTMFNGFFSAAEIAILSVRRTRLEELASRGSHGARAALRLRAMPERFLATVQVGITVLGATAGAFGGATLEGPLTSWLIALGLGSAAEEVALGIVVAFVSLLSIVLGELVPKSLALRSSEGVSVLVSRPLLLLARMARPLIWFLTSVSNLLLKPFRDQTTFAESRLSPDELQQLVEESATAGSLSASAGDIASRAIELAQLPVVALLVPRASVVSIARDATPAQAWELLKAHPHARYPVVRGGLDEVEGYVVARELVSQLMDTTSIELSAITRELAYIAEHTPAVDALRAMQQRQTKMAVVVDEHGMNAGIVTIGDIAEELLGEILNEDERPSESIRHLAPGIVLVRGDTPVQQVNRALGIDLPLSTDYTTVAGLLINESGRLLKAGDRLELPEQARFEVVEASPRTIKRVRIELPHEVVP